jgi:hypothetical protein
MCGHEIRRVPNLTAVAVVRFCVAIVRGLILVVTKVPEREPAPGDKDKRDAKGQGKTVIAVKGKAVLDEHRDEKKHATGNREETSGFYRTGVIQYGGKRKKDRCGDKEKCPQYPEDGRKRTGPSECAIEHVTEIPVYENEAVSEVTFLVPEEGPLDTGGKVIADAIDVERDKKEQALNH